MKYKVGQEIYKINKRTHDIEEIKIIDVLYVTSKALNGSRKTYSEDQLDYLLEENIISLDKNIIKEQAIRRLEEQFDIKLKEV